MRKLRGWMVRFGGLFKKQGKDRELDQEIENHLQMHIEDNLRSGMTSDEARRQALIKLGGIESTKEAYRDQRGLPLLETFCQDIRYGARMLLKNPGFTVVAVLTLALGIGANTAIFSLVDAVLMKSLPVKLPEQLVTLGTIVSGQPGPAYSSFSYPVFREMREKDTVFSGMFARSGRPMSMSGGGQTERVQAELVSVNFYSVLGVNPHLGRLLTEADDMTAGAHPVAVISYNFWQRRFGADPSIVGKTIHLNGYPFTVIGVSAKDFYGVEVGSVPDVRIPLMMDSQVRPAPAPAPHFLERRDREWLAVMARLKSEVSIEQAKAATDNSFQIAREPDVRAVVGETSDNRYFRSLHIQLERVAASGRGRRWELSRLLVSLQVGLSLVLLVGAGLFARSLQNLKTVDTGYRSDQIVIMALDPAQIGYKSGQLRTFYTDLSQRLATLPGMKATTYTRNAPISGSFSRYGIEVSGYQPRAGEEMAVFFNQVDAQFFTTFGIPLLSGREFGRMDTPGSPRVTIVNKSLARYYFADGNPIGKRITLEDYKDLEIVGVVADAKYQDLKEASPKTAYIPYSQYTNTDPRILGVRATGDATAIVAAIRQAVRSLDPNLPIYGIKTFAEQINDTIRLDRLVALLSSLFGLLALLLAVLGLYGVVAYSVTRRTREIGIRLALGAQRTNVLQLILRNGMKLTVLGMVLGLVGALGLTRILRNQLYQVGKTDPGTFAAVALMLGFVGFFACLIPARRATKVDPIVALRHE